MEITILYFASLREALGVERERVDAPATIATVADLREWLRSRGEPWSGALDAGRAIRMAVEHSMVGPSAPLKAGCEVAFFPPVTGG